MVDFSIDDAYPWVGFALAILDTNFSKNRLKFFLFKLQ